jgi:hypothetical protein
MSIVMHKIDSFCSKCFALALFAYMSVAPACIEPASPTADMDTSVDMPVADQGADLPVTDLGMDQGVDMAPDQTSACASACSGATPVCDAASGMCVGCLASADCTGALKACDVATKTCVACIDDSSCTDPTNTCDTSTNSCVQCVGNANCTDPTSSRCDANSCGACMSDNDCSHIAGKGICSGGACVECTVSDESACAGKSCDPATNMCTGTGVGSVGECGACVADSECDETAGYRCIPLGFGPVGMRVPLGGFCLLQADMAGGACPLPYRVGVSAVSLSGASSESYCGINENYTTCPAVLSMLSDEVCNVSGDCGVSGLVDGVCLDFVGLGPRCNVECDDNNQCTSDRTCRTVAAQPGNNQYCAPN